MPEQSVHLSGIGAFMEWQRLRLTKQLAQAYLPRPQQSVAVVLCQQCAKHPSRPNTRQCASCWLQSNRKRKPRPEGVCHRCGKVPPRFGKTCCEACAAIHRRQSAARRELKQAMVAAQGRLRQLAFFGALQGVEA